MWFQENISVGRKKSRRIMLLRKTPVPFSCQSEKHPQSFSQAPHQKTPVSDIEPSDLSVSRS
jgi:hypothetical protein